MPKDQPKPAVSALPRVALLLDAPVGIFRRLEEQRAVAGLAEGVLTANAVEVAPYYPPIILHNRV